MKPPGSRRAAAPVRLLPLWLGLALAGSVAFSSALAQDARVSATASADSIRVGEQLGITVTVEHPAGTAVRSLLPSDSLRGLEIVRIDSVEGSGPAGPGPLVRIFTITAFDTGTWVFPPFTARYGGEAGGGDREVSGPPVAIVVLGVAVDTSAEIKAIKPPLEAPITFAELLPYILGIVFAALAGWLIYYIVRKRRRGEKLIPAAPPRPAGEIALEALRAIEAERLWQRGLVKEYHSRLTDVLRTYIERRFMTLAMESTSAEILSSPPVASADPAASSALREVLLRADLVKFAKFIPPHEENEWSFAAAVTFVLGTSGAAAAVPSTPAAVPSAPAVPATIEGGGS